ncbi:MAG: DUF6259 domain-containing protein [Sedimentisphaerales bacterium]|jgi:hypothetical protein
MSNKIITLESDKIKLELTQAGQINSLYNKTTGTEFFHTDKPTGWKVITSLGQWRGHPISDSMNVGCMHLTGNQAQIQFDGLIGDEQTRLDIILTLMYKLKGDQIELQARIDNRSPETVKEIWFPFVSGFKKITPQLMDHLTLPMVIGAILDEPAKNLPYGRFVTRAGGKFFTHDGWSHYPLPYPGVASMAWMDFFNQAEGLYLGVHDVHCPTTSLLARGRTDLGDFQLGFGRYPFVLPGEQWESAIYILKLHTGDWHAGARCYREFTASRGHNVVAPEWIREMPGVQGAFHIQQNKHIMRPYESLLDIFRANKQRGLNLPLFVFAWFKNGHDSDYPEYEPDPRLGGKAALKKVIKTIKAEGGRIILYTQGRLIDKKTRYYREIGSQICLKNEDGVEYVDEYSFNESGNIYPGKIFALACPSTEQWYETLRQQIDMVMDLGASGILFDQIAGDPPFLCFDQSHPHRKPDLAFDGKVQLLKRLQDYAAAHDPEFVIMSELACDAYLSCVDLSHGYATHPRPGLASLRNYPELYKYTFPEHRITSRDTCTIYALNYVFAAGLMLESFHLLQPPERDYLERLMKLRVKLSRFFAEGTFIDTDGFNLQPEGLAAKAFLANTGAEKAIVIFNPLKSKNRAVVEVDRQSEDWQIIGVGIETMLLKTALGKPLEFEIQPGELKVLIVK